MSGHDDYERERARLSQLPRAERFEELIQFPTRHMFKVIGARGGGPPLECGPSAPNMPGARECGPSAPDMPGAREGLSDEVRRVLAGLGFGEVILVERHSSGGRHLSLTFELDVDSGALLDAIYSALEGIDNVSYLF